MGKNKKIAATVIVIIMVIVSMSILISAAENTSVVPEGYTAIWNIDDLYAIRNNPSDNYILMADINMSEATAPGGAYDMGHGWSPIDTFSGIFDGNGHTITGMHIHGEIKYSDGGALWGLFASIKGGTVQNLGMEDVAVDIVQAPHNGIKFGAITGSLQDGIISGCYVTGNITGERVDSHSKMMIAGIVADGEDSTVINCYNAAVITGSGRQKYGPIGVGGIVGIDPDYGYGSTSIEVKNCINTQKIILSNDIHRSSPLGGSTDGCYYVEQDFEYSNYYEKRLTEAQLQNAKLMDKLDFTNTWFIDIHSGINHPQLLQNPENAAVSMEWVSKPSKLTYKERSEGLNTSNGKIKITYEDGKTATIDLDSKMISGFNNNSAGKQTLTVTYSGKQLTYQVEILHDYTASVVAPTCTEDGYTLHKCNQCGHSYSDTPMKAKGHSFDLINTVETFLASAATCTEKAVYYYSCSCGAKGTETFTSGMPLGHSYSEYRSDSSNHWRECRCGDKKDEESHQEGDWVITTEATYNQSGEHQKSCLICNRVLKTETLDRIDCNHKLTEIRGASEPLCQQNGYTGDTVCKACNSVLQEGKLIDAITHQWDKGTTAVDGDGKNILIRTCLNCGVKQTDGKYVEAATEAAVSRPDTLAVATESNVDNGKSTEKNSKANTEPSESDDEKQDNILLIGIIIVAATVVFIFAIDRVYRYKLSQKQ